MRAAVAVLAALILTACERPAPEPAPAPAAPAEAPAPPAAATPPALPAELQGDIEGRGTEPFWAVKVTGGQITLERPDHPTVAAGAGSVRAEDGAAVWEAATVNPPLRVTARVQPGCSDGMSDLSYPLAVEVTVGGETLKGCGARAGEMPRGER
ncbi:COG3650 family protein [Phenylobacterium terrae]|uniref:COG3650 family protein n=1 Tax=Phenylobacterium terrae TaxID=2665495 RepID=A0ABW4MYZ3_9CAUL